MNAPTPRQLHVLVVDDGPLNRQLVSRLLESLDCRVELASGGIEAVRKTLANRYDLVLMDLQMPDLDGRGALQRIRAGEALADRWRTPILALTADEPTTENLGFDGHLTKPVSLDTLRTALQRVDELESEEPEVPPELVAEFLETVAADYAEMARAIAGHDFALVARKAHGLKGTGRAFGFPTLSEVGATLEHLATTSESREEIETCLTQLADLLNQGPRHVRSSSASTISP